ncbi:KaiC domain-containing protein [Halobacteriales archaeon QS_1_68_17]|nr:MAG: KaiC domain-containing protein [Halobacteriales archaeon QS_1_68_17]
MSDDEEDWFESALSDLEDEERDAGDGSGSDDRSGSREGDADRRDDADRDGESPFDASFEEEFADADAPESGPFEGDAAGDPFGDAADGPFGGDDGGGGGGGGLFDEDFASAMGSAGGGDAGFDDEDFESEIPRIDLGIEGLDRMIQGGVPERSLIVTVGGPGTGKTTFGLQFLHNGLEQDEDAVFITLEQSRTAIMDTANERGWAFDDYADADRLAVIDLDPVEMANSIDNIRGELPPLIEEFEADRLVLDSVSLLEMMYDDQAGRRTEVFDFTRSLKDAGVTTMLTSEANESNPYASRHGIIEYLTDAVIVLQYVRDGTRETRLAVEIQKIRNANHSRETKPYEITGQGISVYEQASIF